MLTTYKNILNVHIVNKFNMCMSVIRKNIPNLNFKNIDTIKAMNTKM